MESITAKEHIISGLHQGTEQLAQAQVDTKQQHATQIKGTIVWFRAYGLGFRV